MQYIKKHNDKPIYVGKIEQESRLNILAQEGLTVRRVRQHNMAERAFDFTGMIEDINKAEVGSYIYLHSSCHPMTGVDPTME